MSSLKLVKSIAMVLVLLFAFATLSSCGVIRYIRSVNDAFLKREHNINKSSAFSDARNALQLCLAEAATDKDDIDDIVVDGTVFEVVKADEAWYFVWIEDDKGLYEADSPRIGMSSIHDMPSCGAKIDVPDINNFPTNVTMYYPAP